LLQNYLFKISESILSLTLTILTAFILFAYTLVRSAVRIGDALLAKHLLGLIMSLRIASPMG
ncbi:MAG: hypothetical protein ACK45T_15415, partial [Pseudanabaena sp.]